MANETPDFHRQLGWRIQTSMLCEIELEKRCLAHSLEQMRNANPGPDFSWFWNITELRLPYRTAGNRCDASTQIITTGKHRPAST